MTAFAVSQLLVCVAFVCDIASFQFRSRSTILACLIASTAFTAMHYFLLENSVAALLMLLASLRFSVAYFSKRRLWMWLFMGVALLILVTTYREPVNLVAFLGSVLLSFASFQPHDRSLRLWMMGGTSMWLTHNVLIGSPAAVLLEVFFLGSNLVGFWRFYLRSDASPKPVLA